MRETIVHDPCPARQPAAPGSQGMGASLGLPPSRIVYIQDFFFTFFFYKWDHICSFLHSYFFCNIILWAFSQVNKYSPVVWFSMTTRYFIFCTCHNLFNCSPIFGHLDCF